LVLASTLTLLGCAGKSTVINEKGKASTYQNVDDNSNKTIGIGIESQDISSIVDKMLRDIVNAPQFNSSKKPRIIIDSKYFNNQSSSRINKDMIVDKLLVNLNRAAQGRMFFLDRENLEMVVDERELKREGELSKGNLGNTDKILGADYRLTGKILSLDTLDNSSGEESRYHQIIFKLIDLETSAVVWSNMYEFKKASASNVVYR
jgi:penicillin-binding protein activator